MSGYVSPLRARQAAQTRRAVIDAAAELFAAQGYGRTSLRQIAAVAGVSLETVQAQGRKRSLLASAVRISSFGRDVDESVLAAPEAAALQAASTPEQFAVAAARLLAGLASRTAGVWRAFVSAAADDPEVDAELSQVDAMIRANVAGAVQVISDRGWLRTDIDTDELTTNLWLLVSNDNYDKLTRRLGWNTRTYERWLTRAITDLLFRPAPEKP
ncbi:TetR/AcrR family transcriptional regulator [Nocardia takedensis]|uniref:TetR/AcrR family transcriptional regulator n=1 Tax=Nocardia takedensis TaxID=259390 RepID=UPI0002F1CE2E|nr:TetR family transcriptional regulator [Nocardia takedensis]